jgi:hypothetical protein
MRCPRANELEGSICLAEGADVDDEMISGAVSLRILVLHIDALLALPPDVAAWTEVEAGPSLESVIDSEG